MSNGGLSQLQLIKVKKAYTHVFLYVLLLKKIAHSHGRQFYLQAFFSFE